MGFRHCISIFLACLPPAISLAQLEEIVVTGSRVDPYGMPAVTVVKEADFLVQSIRLMNDSRAPDLRRDEIIDTIEVMLRRAEQMPGMALSYGTGFLEPINLTDESLQLIEDRERVDTSFVEIYAKVEFDADAGARDQISALRDFISGTEVVGRTEIETLGDIGLSIIAPEQYRYEIIRAIADENRRLQEALGNECKVSIDGLEARVEWERTNVSELTLYIPYGIDVSDCQP